MSKSFFKFSFLIISFSGFNFCLNANPTTSEKVSIEQLKDNPALSLNPMDVPFFQQDDNPLKDMGTFAVVSLMRFDSQEMKKKADAIIEKELSNLGRVIQADQKGIDLRGIGSRNFLILDSGKVKNSDGKSLPVYRISLRIQTPVTLTKTGLNTLPNVWAINDFVESSEGTSLEDKRLSALQKLLVEFKKNYEFVNSDRPEKAIFYIYQ